MNQATIRGFRMLAASMVTITITPEGFQVRSGTGLLGVTSTEAGAKELASLVTGLERQARGDRRHGSPTT
jgi:hypothetical protein